MKKMFNPLISIVIPVYNGENYLKEAIESALAQTYKNKEIIVVNDGSKDDTDKIAKKFEGKIKYIKKENGGVATALNLAIKNMNGEYFSWLSHDDLYLPNKLEKQVEFLEKQNDKNVVLYTDYEIIDENGKKVAVAEKNHNELEQKPEYSLLRGNVNGITMLIPKKCFEECGLFNESLRCTQDYDLWRRIIKKYSFIHLPIVTASTRIHSMQDSQISPKAVIEGNKLWIEMIEDISDNRKKELEGTIFDFYSKMAIFLKQTPYEKAYEYALNMKNIIENRALVNRKNIKVSVIIPFYNRINLLINSIDSVLNNTFKNVEIVLIDDCSTDSIDSLQEFIKDKKNIFYYKNKENKGPSYSRNVGIEKSTGEYIAFLDSDDEFMPNKITVQLSEMLLYNAKASYTDYYISKKDEIIEFNSYVKNDKTHNEFIDNCKLATPTIMIKRDFLVDNDIKYNVNYNVCEDCIFYLEILKKTDFLYVNSYLTKVNVFETSHVNNYAKRMKGMKNILNYVLNDEIYCNNALEMSYLINGYRGLLNHEKNIPQVSEEDYEILKKKLSSAEKTINELEKDNIKLNDLLKKSENEIATLNQRIVDIYNSKSMKLTSAFRKIRKTINKK